MNGRTVVACAMMLALVACRGERAAPPKLAPVTRGPIAEVVSATGEVSALLSVNVGSQISGTISKLNVDFNTPVKKGDVLAELDARLFESALGRAEAGLAAARADAERARVAALDARRTADRAALLLARNLVSAADMDAATAARDAAGAALEAAHARVAQARAERDAAETNVALCKIRSPIDGIVISRSVDVGQTVASSLQAPTLFFIANDLSNMQILANVDEADVGKVKDGMPARFTVDAYPGQVFQGRIREVRQAPTTVQNVVTYAAVIAAPNPDGKLRQGMTASVSIVTSARESALRIPSAALRYRPAGESSREPSAPARSDGSRASRAEGEGERSGIVKLASANGPASAERAKRADAFATGRAGVRKVDVYKLEGDGVVRTSILVGISDGHATEVVEGLVEGDKVVVGDGAAAAATGGKRGPF